MVNLDKILDAIISMSESIEMMNKVKDKDSLDIDSVNKLIDERDIVRVGLIHFHILQEEFNRLSTEALGLDYPVELVKKFDRFMDRNRTFLGNLDDI